MKKNFLLTFIAFITVLFSCVEKISKRQNKDSLNELIIKILEKDNSDDKEKQLYLFIADYSCTECIRKEYTNISNNGSSIAIIGLFSNKRNFLSSTDYKWVKKRIFIDRNKNDAEKTLTQLFYFIYDKKNNTISDIFYPISCEEEKTISYFQKVKTIILE